MRKKLLIILLTILECSLGFAQVRKTVTGTVKDARGEAIPGVSVIEKGTTNGTQTNVNGTFTLSVNANAVLKFSFLGYTPKEVPVGTNTTLTVTLSEDSQSLGEVVVTAFGQKKEIRKLSYSMQEVKGEELTRANNANIVNSLQGKVAGVMINQGASGPQSSSRIRIRGNSSISTSGSSSTQPLFVIDGVLIKPGTTGADSWGGNQDFGNIMKDLNPDDYESISVLKGAPATALYGSDALNGVILITTKKGVARKGLGVSLSHTSSFDDAYKLYDLQDEFGGGISTTWQKNAQGVDMVDKDNGQFYSFGPKIDGHMVQDIDGRMVEWKANKPLDFFQTGRYINTNVALEGGSENTTFRFSYSNLYNNSIMPENSLKRNNFSLRATQKVSKFLNLDASIVYVDNNIDNPASQGGSDNPLFRLTYYRPRTMDIDYWKNHYIDTELGGRTTNNVSQKDPYNISNFLWNIYQIDNTQRENNFRANVDLTATITPWLNALLRSNINLVNTEQEYKELGRDVNFAGGNYWFSQINSKQSRIQLLLNGSRNLSKDLELSLSAGGETNRDLGGKYNRAITKGGLNIPGQFVISNGKEGIQGEARSLPEKRLDALYAFGDITYKNMLTFNFSARNDWSSALTYANGAGTYNYFYPSAGLAWTFTEMDMFKWQPLTSGKLRVSYGYAGRDTDPFYLNRTGFYSQLGTFDAPGGTYPIYSYVNGTLGNFNIKPELSKEFEIGTNLRFLNNRIDLDFTYYKKNTTNQILELPVPIESGASSRIVNAGNIQNQGIEILLNTVPVKSKNFEWSSSFNFSRNRNKILELAEGITSKDLELAFGNDVRAVAQVGKDYGTIVTGYGFASYQKRDAAGNPVASPSNGKKVIGLPSGGWGYTYLRNAAYDGSTKELGTMMENFLVSNINSFRYKDFTVGIQLDAKIGGLMASATHQYGGANGSLQSSLFGRDKEHGGVEYVDDNGVTQFDGIIPDGVFQDGITVDVNNQTIDLGGMSYAEAVEKGYVKPKPAYQYYDDLTQWGTGIREYSVFENSWVAVREVSVNYRVPVKFSSKIGVSNLSLTATGRNLGYLYNTTKDGINPEGIFTNRQAGFAEYGGWPYVRSIGFGINAKF
ncbi:SusC/RagA family TonB-linked outer membrane protein [Rubrolithibacter danxiaensis]|uniref:SusC/RagA family TonB-linked outer membrane protein n=1 Tax=Rubrolithibacter danxiaensis TaxID=3390805 RepID=UPI003BF7FD10